VGGVNFVVVTPRGEFQVSLALPGAHNVGNALAATAVGLACGLELAEIKAGLESVRSTGGRLAVSVAPGGATLIDDCYNANPGSVRAAIDLLAGCQGRRTLVLGAMLELGERSEQLHRETGAYAADAGIEQFCGVGPLLRPAVTAFGAGGRWFSDCDAAVAALAGEFAAGDTVLVKGSRGARMEQLLHALQAGEPARGN
jgi:UDP-N-acetylmuramoyl-tripeptide--D-alanyl-D-alanine ligase